MAQYPPEDFDRGRTMMQQLGSFWNLIFQDADRLQAHVRSSGNEHGQTYLDFLEAVACVSRFNVPVFHAENWYLLTIRRSDTKAVMSIYQPDDLVYGPQPGGGARPEGFTQVYGGEDWPGFVQAALPDDMVDAPYALHNLVVNPSLTLAYGVDYDVDGGKKAIRFRDDPFNNALIPSRDIVDSAGNVVDTEIALWAYKGQFDLDYVYMQFGYALGLKLASSQGYKDLLNAFWDMYMQGPSVALLGAFLSAVSGTPTCLEAAETVELVTANEIERIVATDQHVYRFPLGATILVAAGDVIHAGEAISDAFQVKELSGADFDLSLLSELVVSGNMASGNFVAPLVFENRDAALNYVGLDPDGKAIVTFETSGIPADVATFWAAVHARGKAAGKTLAEYLDIRADPVGEPGPASLPATVNPAEFLIENLMRSNLFILVLRESSFGPGAVGADLCRLLREVLPPHTAYVTILEPVSSSSSSSSSGSPSGSSSSGGPL